MSSCDRQRQPNDEDLLSVLILDETERGSIQYYEIDILDPNGIYAPAPANHIIDIDGVIIFVSGVRIPDDVDFDIIFTDRAGMGKMANGGTIMDLTDIVLMSGIPEAYYTAGWFGGRIYGFTLKPINTDKLMIYNKNLINMAGISETPGDLFDSGRWSWDDFYDYCFVLTNILPAGTDAIQANDSELSKHLVYADGGIMYHHESGTIIENSPIIQQTNEFVNRMIQNGLLQQRREEARPAIFLGGMRELMEMLEAGEEVGIVPYPLGPNAAFNGNYRTVASEADVVVFTAGNNDVSGYIDLLFDYFNLYEELYDAGNRERMGLNPYYIQAETRDRLHAADLRRLEWIYAHSVYIKPN